jgi:hypothetical protein
MNCPFCRDNGLIRLRYQEHPDTDYGLCSCAKGQRFRTFPRSLIARTFNTDEAHVGLIEDFLEPHELPGAHVSGDLDLAAVGRTRKGAKL